MSISPLIFLLWTVLVCTMSCLYVSVNIKELNKHFTTYSINLFPYVAALSMPCPVWPTWRRHGLPGRPEGAVAWLADLKAPWPAWPTWRRHGLPGRPEGGMACPQIKAHWAEDGPDCPIAWVQAGPGFVYTCSVLQQKINSLFR